MQDNKNLTSIKLMNNLLKQATELKEEAMRKNIKSKDQLMKEASELIHQYFRSFQVEFEHDFLQVELDRDYYIQFMKHREKGSLFAKDICINNQYISTLVRKKDKTKYSILPEHAKKYIDRVYIRSLEEEQLLYLIRYFKLIKKKVEEAASTMIHNMIQANADELKKDSECLEMLVEFVKPKTNNL
ncbi:hypothetical protein [Cytobacillus purgationiresistens]|uniref:IDEAL domain-containing protein n=1 Tax=Cytobacillus purgationiresistens TaxID=863449 RepID=A0ABU0AIZ1_9BACI|nr:hypothetical protein [Cytobacillus purgationiresistens]MDQ0271226.1 hypothetical protein [Cytobacillus purgationiresistens]